ncbi:MAG: hypothetical protein ACLQU4_17700 [Limisphaerales bacterium]
MHLQKSILRILPLAVLALFCGCQKHEEKLAVPTLAGPRPAIVSAEKTSFDEVTAKLDKGGNLYLYLSTEQALSGLSGKIAGFSNIMGNLPGVTGDQNQTIGRVINVATACLKDSGIEQISGVGMSSIARERGFYYGKLIVHHYPGQNAGAIWSMLGKAPHPLQELDLLPESTVLATFTDLDVLLVWNNVHKHLELLEIPAVTDAMQNWPAQFHKMTGLDFDDVLASLGGNYGVIFTLDEQKKVTLPIPGAPMEIPSPGLAIVAKVNSDVIFNRIDALCKSNPLVVRVDTADLRMRTMNLPIPLPVELRPSIARSGDYLLLATSDTLVQEILAVKAGKAKGFKSTAEFAKLSQGVPEDGNIFSLVADRFVKAMMQIQQQSLTNKGTMTAAQIDAMQRAFHTGTNYGSYSVGVNGPEGWEGSANGPQSAQTVLIGGAIGIAVMAAMVVPTLIKAHQATHPAKTASYTPQPNGAPTAAVPTHDVRVPSARSVIFTPAAKVQPAAL